MVSIAIPSRIPGAGPDSNQQVLRKELLGELARGQEHPGFVFAGRYALTLVPLICAGTLLGLSPGVGTAILFAIVAGFTHNALGVLMHEGSHFFFHRNRRVNDALANLLVCLPVFNTVAGYRHEHLDHHRRSGEPDDPYYELYTRYRQMGDMVRGLAQDIFGFTAVRAFLRRYRGGKVEKVEARRGGGLRDLASLAAVQGAIALGLWALTGWPFAWLVLWVLPLMTIPVTINRVRTFVEHFPGREAVAANRTTITGAFEYLCIAPYGYSHHYAHHFAPTIPYYRLAEAHRFLVARGEGLGVQQYNDAGYLRAFVRMLRELESGPVRAA